MQAFKLEPKKATQLFGALTVFLLAVIILTGRQQDPGVAAAGVLLVLVSILPVYLWLLGWSHGLPLWPVFAAINGLNAAMPMIQDQDTLRSYSTTEVIVGGTTVLGCLLLGTIVWVLLTTRAPKPPKTVLSISQAHAVRYLLVFVLLGVLFAAGLIRLPGNLMQVSRGVTMSLNLMALFVLAYYHGTGLLKKSQFWLMVAGCVATVAVSLTSLMLAQAFVPVAMPILGYMLGSGKFPWRIAGIVFVVAAILHPGKYEMRARYWGGEATGTLSLNTMPTFYSEWFSTGLNEIGGLTGVSRVNKEEDERSSIFERGGNLQMLLLVQRMSPNEVPYSNGATYEPIPRLLIPRFIDSDKGISHAANVMLAVNYGVLTVEGAATTSVGWGLIPEAYANFSYLGVALLAVFLGCFYAFFTRISSGVPMTSLRFVIGLIVLAAATSANTMGIFITSQFQGIVGVALASFFLMRRQPNPLYYVESGEGTEQNRGLARWPLGKAWSRERGDGPSSPRGLRVGERQEAGGMPHTAYGGTVRTMPIRMPKRIASWMPRRVRQQVAEAARSAAEEGAAEGVAVGQKDGGSVEPSGSDSLRVGERPRQLAVPYRNYRRYRSG